MLGNAFVLAVENVSLFANFQPLTFVDGDNKHYGGGTLEVLDTNLAALGGDGNDFLTIDFRGGAGEFSYDAATHEISYGFNRNSRR